MSCPRFVLLAATLIMLGQWPVAATAQEGPGDNSSGDTITAPIPPHEWFTHPWTPLAHTPNIFDMTGAFRFVTNFNYNQPNHADGQPAAGEVFTQLRLEPRFVINGPFEIRSRLEVRGGLGYGQTTELNAVGWYNSEPLAVTVQRLWMELGIFNQRALIAVGRVPRHVGLGIWQNSGNGPEATHASGLDQVQVALKLGSILLLPSAEFLSSGPQIDNSSGMPLDLDNIDDAWGLTMTIALIDSPEDLAILMRRQEVVWNFSSSIFYRQQARWWTKDNETQEDVLTRTDGRMAGLDLWLAVYKPYFRFEFEGIFYWHTFNLDSLGKISGVPFALALEWAYWPDFHSRHRKQDEDAIIEHYNFDHRLGFKFKAGLASGDKSSGFANIENNISQASDDHHIQSFVFHPDYFVDRILFRRVLGSVTESFYLRPEIAFLIQPQLLASVAVIYSGALFSSSTPGGKSPLGTEFEARISWHSKNTQGIAGLEEHQPFLQPTKPEKSFNGLEIAMNYNLLLPLSGLNGYIDRPVHLLELSFLLTF